MLVEFTSKGAPLGPDAPQPPRLPLSGRPPAQESKALPPETDNDQEPPVKPE